MKNFKKAIIICFVSACFLFGALGFRATGFAVEKNRASAEVGFYSFSLNLGSRLEVYQLFYNYNGNRVEYSASGFISHEEDGEPIYFEDEFGEVALYKITDDDNNESYANLGQVEANDVLCDPSSRVELKLVFNGEGAENSYYINKLGYKQGASSSGLVEHLIAEGTHDEFGNVSYTREGQPFNVIDGYNAITINTFYEFRFKEVAGGMDVVIPSIKGDVGLVVGSSIKSFGINIEGEEEVANLGSPTVNYNETAVVTLVPDSGKIIDEVLITNGHEDVLKLYGGMYTEMLYYFGGGETHDNVFSYGNYALGYESFTGKNYEIISDASSNTIKVLDRENSNDYFSVTIYGNGQIVIEKEKMDKDITISISTQNFLQVNLLLKNLEDSEVTNKSVIPFESVIIGGVDKFEGLTELERASTHFVIGFNDDIYIEIKLNLGYSFDPSLDASFVVANKYIRNLSPDDGVGIIDVITFLDNACSIDVHLFNNGTLDHFISADTKVYFYIAGGEHQIVGDSEEARINSFKALITSGVILPESTSAQGQAQKLSIPSGSTVYMCIRINPYYMMTFDDGVFAYEYVKEILITEKESYVANIELLSFEGKPVIDSSGNFYGRLKLSVSRSVEGVYSYSVFFGTPPMYSVIKSNNPQKMGYDLVNMEVNGTAFLTYFSAYDEFHIDNNDVNIHKFIAEHLFGAEEVIASFTAKRVSFVIKYTVDGSETLINGLSYYDSDYMYLEEIPIPPNNYTFFGGISYLHGADVLQTLVDGDYYDGIQREESGEFEGFYKYRLAGLWNIDASGLLVDAVFINKSYTLELVYTRPDGTTQILEEVIQYGEEFIIDELNKAQAEPFDAPDIEGKYNHVGWVTEGDESVNFIIKDDVNYDGINYFSNDQLYTYSVPNGLRLIPVFSAGSIIITFKQDGEIIHTVTVTYDAEVSVEHLLAVDGEYIVPAQHAYTFLGFYTAEEEGRAVINYTPDYAPDVYTIDFAGNIFSESLPDGFFGLNEQETAYVWKLERNVDLFVRWDANFLTLNMHIDKDSSRQAEDVRLTKLDGSEPEPVWRINKTSVNEYIIDRFIVTDSFKVINLKPLDYHFISSIIVNGEEVYSAICNSNGEVEPQVSAPLFFDIENGVLTIVAEEFINEETALEVIDIKITYSVVGQVITFYSAPFNEDHEEVATGEKHEIKFVVQYYYNDISKVSNWVWLTYDGNSYVFSGWQDLTVTTTAVLDESSLYGGTFANFVGNDGNRYYFKGWQEETTGEFLKHDTKLFGERRYVSVFSYKFDVKINYNVYNTQIGDYQVDTVKGQFWAFSPASNSYQIDNMYTLNSYEVTLYNSSSYYVSNWTRVRPTGFGLYNEFNEANYYGLGDVITGIEYSPSMQVINLYAIYSPIVFGAFDEGESIITSVDVPNDASNKSYSRDDVYWISVGSIMINQLTTSGISLEDALTNYFNGSGVFTGVSGSHFATGRELDDYTINSKGFDDETYIIMVLIREENIDEILDTGRVHIYFAHIVGQVKDFV